LGYPQDGDPQLIAAAREDVARSRALVYTGSPHRRGIYVR
jgi:DNA-binding phage protein